MFTSKPSFLVPVVSSALFALAAACGSSSPSSSSPSPSPSPSPDSGADGPDGSLGSDDGSSSDPEPDGGTKPDTGGAPGEGPQLLVQGDVVLRGMTTDEHVIYTRKTIDGQALEAVSVEDGTITTIWDGLSADASLDVKGNAVAIWTDVGTDTGLGSFSYWVPGRPTQRKVAHLSPRETFWATTDGALIAFEANASLADGVPTSAELVVVSTATGALTPVLTDAERVAFDACGGYFGFAGDSLVAAYCPPDATTAKLVTVPKVAQPARQVLVDGGLRPMWKADATGSKIFVLSDEGDEGRIVSNDGTLPAPWVAVEKGVQDPFMLRDGSAVVYRTGTTLRRAPIGTPGPIVPVSIVNGDVRGILDVSLDQTRILYHALDGIPVDTQFPDGERYFDVRAIATDATDGAPNVLVDTERALPLSLTGSGGHALYFSKSPKLVAAATDGSGDRSMPLDFNGMDVAPSGSHAILSVNSRPLDGHVVVDLVHVDFSKNGAEAGSPMTKPIAQSIGSAGFRFASKNRLVYVHLAAKGQGLYRVDLP